MGESWEPLASAAILHRWMRRSRSQARRRFHLPSEQRHPHPEPLLDGTTPAQSRAMPWLQNGGTTFRHVEIWIEQRRITPSANASNPSLIRASTLINDG